MGFGVTLGQNATLLTSRLTASPYSVFGGPYAGYVLFLFDLVSEHDEFVTEWFQKNAEPLDALTGSDVAFAVFAQNVHVRLKVPYGSAARRPAVKDVMLTDCDTDFDVDRLVKDGRCGWVTDGDEIHAANQAVYRLAREFGVTNQLPCIVALDGIPDPSVSRKCFPLSKDVARDLYPILRRAVGTLQTSPDFAAYQSALRALCDKAKESRTLEARAKECEAKLETTQPAPSPVALWLSEIGVALRRGNHRLLSRRLRNLSALHANPNFASTFEAKFFSRAAALLRGVRGLDRLLGKRWPLAQDDIEDLRTLCSETIQSFALLEPGVVRFEGREDLVALHKHLGQLRALWLATAMKELPSEKQWLNWAEAQRRRQVLDELDSCNHSLSRVDLEIHSAVKSLLAWHERPSWCKTLQDAMGDALLVPIEHDIAPPSQNEDASLLLDWVDLPDSMKRLRRLDVVGLFGVLRKLIVKFGNSVWERRPTAFASYASTDRAEVLRRVQGMRAFQPRLDIFLDFQSLCPGELWKKRLSEEIALRDRFFLFWSRAASQSEFVREEWRAALRLDKPITPVPLCSPSEVPPPKELANLQFSDCYFEFLRCTQLPV